MSERPPLVRPWDNQRGSLMTTINHASLAGQREWIGLGVLALPCLLYSMDLTVLNLAVPALSRDLAPSSTQLLWIVEGRGAARCGIVYGRRSAVRGKGTAGLEREAPDRILRRKQCWMMNRRFEP
jgi:hypothetical protein